MTWDTAHYVLTGALALYAVISWARICGLSEENDQFNEHVGEGYGLCCEVEDLVRDAVKWKTDVDPDELERLCGIYRRACGV